MFTVRLGNLINRHTTREEADAEARAIDRQRYSGPMKKLFRSAILPAVEVLAHGRRWVLMNGKYYELLWERALVDGYELEDENGTNDS